MSLDEHCVRVVSAASPLGPAVRISLQLSVEPCVKQTEELIAGGTASKEHRLLIRWAQ